MRDLSILSIVVVFKTLAISKIVYLELVKQFQIQLYKS